MRKYLTGHIWEWICCFIMSAVVVVFLAQGFYIPERIGDSIPLALVISAAVTLGCYVLGYNRRTMKITPVILIVIAAAFVLLLRFGRIDIVDMEGSETSIFIYVFAILLFPIIYYLLTRTKVGMIISVGMGAALFGVIAYLDYETKVWWLVLFLLAGMVMMALRIYRHQAKKSSTYAPNFKNLCLSALIVAVIATAVSGGVYGAIIRPLNPPTIDMELIIKVLTYDMLDRIGVAQYYTIPDELLQAYQEMYQIESSNKNEIETEPEEDPSEEEQDDEAEGEQTGIGGAFSRLMQAVKYNYSPAVIITFIVIIIAIIVAVIILIKFLLWKRKKRKIAQMSPRDRVVYLCRFYMERFRRIGYGKQPHYTETEYVTALSDTLDRYLEGSMTFAEFMRLYSASRYGDLDPTPEEEKKLIGLYDVFKKNFRRIRGNLKFIIRYIRL